ncbi:tryptophan synthase subunit alpha [Fictibacillus macauensis ZFHKF-1]|uniref:Tryptophan synthase alpha chain n=1 Tax=Fictibacillus macauensis ZFHKF-1 TaxID=1196324 RepID=I8AL52_9BACL|nr:tryptophan synthase subunit alpha [Fictibacillus macauensis]EIT86597.1 tryptophan synthase subunit alpha [Fictibacillus macauensis ZFHKF-1]
MTERMNHFQQKEKHVFVPFITAGDPSPDSTVELALTLEANGASALELGIPYSDPLADGPVIQRASLRALQQGMTLEKAMTLVGTMREKGLTIPVIIFTYYNLLLQLGEQTFYEQALRNGIDGLLVPDLPFEESESLRKGCEEHDLSLISLVAPTTSPERLAHIGAQAHGFLYCISSLGVTGTRSSFSTDVMSFLEKAKAATSIPVLIGFGLSHKTQMQAFESQCDGFIVGSAIVKKIEELGPDLVNEETRDTALGAFSTYIAQLVP